MFKKIYHAEYIAKTNNISEAVKFAEQCLDENFDSKKKARFLLSLEEILVQLCDHAANEETVVHVKISKSRQQVAVNLSCAGDSFSLDEGSSLDDLMNGLEEDDEQYRIIKSMLQKLYSDNVCLRNSKGVNRVLLTIEPKKKTNKTIVAIGAGIVAGLFVRFLIPQTVTDFVLTNVVTLISDLFMHAIKMVLVPLVFFSIAESVGGFSDYQSFGRIGAKVVGMYMLTTAFAIALAFGIFMIFKPGAPDVLSSVQAVMGTTGEVQTTTVSLRSTLLNIIPTNIAAAFSNGDMLQIIFIGVLVGLAGNMLGEGSQAVRDFIHIGNSLFSQITTLVIKALPTAVFCIMVNLIATTSAESIVSLAGLFGVVFLAIACMILVVYAMLLWSKTKSNPKNFYKGFSEAEIMAFSTCSSSATMPVSMKCLDKMGVSPKIYSFSIPLGATINMDGSSICYMIMTLFMMRVFSIPLTGSTLFSICLSVLLLSVATPGAPGAGIACQAMLLAQVGIPAEAVSFLLAVYTLLDFVRTTSNVVGDAVVTTVVAKSEGMLDENKFRKVNK